MELKTARNIISGIAVIFWLGTALLVYQIVDLLFFTTGALAFFAPYMVFFGAVLAIVFLITGIGVWRFRPWGRKLALTLAWITIAFLMIAALGSISDPSTFAWRQVVYLVLAIATIWSLQFRKDVKEQFATA